MQASEVRNQNMQNADTDSKTNVAKLTAPAPSAPGGPNAWRRLSNLMCIWALCGRSACRKAGACRGDSRDCVPRCGPLVPPDAKEWIVEMVYGSEGLSFEDACEELAAELEEAWVDWFAAVWRSAGRPRADAINFARQQLAMPVPARDECGWPAEIQRSAGWQIDDR
jgi:hypothetical protein